MKKCFVAFDYYINTPKRKSTFGTTINYNTLTDLFESIRNTVHTLNGTITNINIRFK